MIYTRTPVQGDLHLVNPQHTWKEKIDVIRAAIAL